MLKLIRTHLPYCIGIVLVVTNALLANGTINLSNHAIDVINAVLAALGFGILHKRQA